VDCIPPAFRIEVDPRRDGNGTSAATVVRPRVRAEQYDDSRRNPMATAAVEAAPDAAVATPAKKGKGKLVMIIGAIGLVVVVQTVLTMLLMPKSGAAKPADDAAKVAAAKAVEEEKTDDADNDSAETTVGDFNCTNSTAAPGVVIHLDFKMAALSNKKQASQLKDLLKSHEARVRQIVGQIVRRSPLEDLNDPNLATIRRLVKEDVNRLIRKSLITDVVLMDVRFVEQ
jgi:flagellar basal body-associated protein FliL